MRRLVQEFLSGHLPPLIGMMAQQGVPAEEQRRRADRLVRGLGALELQDELLEEGRRVVARVDADSDPPEITFNTTLLERVDDAEALNAFRRPASEVLDVSDLSVALVLQIRDRETLKSLHNQTAGARSVDSISMTDVPAVAESRFSVLRQRAIRIARTFAERAGRPLPKSRAESLFEDSAGKLEEGREALTRSGGRIWPAWEDLSNNPFVNALVEDLRRVTGRLDGVPSAETIVELCWESLDLSAQSFLRHAARELRAAEDNGDVIGGVLRVLAESMHSGESGNPAELDSWTAFSDLADAWERLFREEQRALPWALDTREPPELSVFEPPIAVLHLCEPESLPWSQPLLAWSTRERSALTDLLEGMRKSLRSTDELLGDGPDPALWRGDEAQQTELADTPLERFSVEPAPFRVDDRQDFRHRTRRAIHVGVQRLTDQFEAHDASGQQRILQQLRSTYDGFFGEAKPVWERRFQAWPTRPKPQAFVQLAAEIQHLLGPTALFDPFEGPDGTSIRRVPTFVFLAGWNPEQEHQRIRVPMKALREAYREAPVRIRNYEIDPTGGPTGWLGDFDLTTETLATEPTEALLGAIEDDAVGLAIYRR
jgi:hypothetical protein